MKPVMTVLTTLAVLLLAAAPNLDTLRLGRIELTVPEGWKGRVEDDRIVLSLQGLPSSESAEIAVEKEQKRDGGFRQWFYELWDSTLKDKQVLKKGQPSWAQTNVSQAFIARAELSGGLQVVVAAFQTDQVRLLGIYRCSKPELLVRGSQLLPDLLKSARIVEDKGRSGDPGADPSAPKREPPVKEPGSKQEPARNVVSPGPGGPGDTTWYFAAGTPGPIVDADIMALAVRAQTDSAQGDEALVSLARAMGMTVVDDDHKVLFASTTEPRTGLQVSKTELEVYRRMSLAGHQVPLSGLFAALDYNLEKLGVKVPLQPDVMLRFAASLWSEHKGKRRFVQGVVALGLLKDVNILTAGAGFDPMLDPLQFLFLTRAVTEDLRISIKNKRNETPDVLWAMCGGTSDGAFTTSQEHGPPGWLDDGFNNALNFVSSLVTDGYEMTNAANFSTVAGILMNIVKFCATYGFLKGDWTIERPPLVRTKLTTVDEETRDLKCRLFFDVPGLLDYMKRNRFELNLIGLGLVDPDMPQNEPLSGKRVEWMLEQGDVRHPERFCVRWSTGMNPLNRPTDAQGVTTMQLTGLRQREKLDQKFVEPYNRTVRVYLFPAVKDNSDKGQAIVDVGFGSLSFVTGPAGILTQLFETIYRARWVAVAAVDVPVRDWVPQACWTAAWNFSGTAGGKIKVHDSPGSKLKLTWSILHSIQTYTMVLKDQNPSDLPQLPTPDVVAKMPPAMRSEWEERLKDPALQEMTVTRRYLAFDVPYRHRVDDTEHSEGEMVDACGPPGPPFWEDSSLYWSDKARFGWDPDRVLDTYPHRDSELLNFQFSVNVQTGKWKLEGPLPAVMALARVSGSKITTEKTGLLHVPLIPGEVYGSESAKDELKSGRWTHEGTLDPSILAAVRDRKAAKADMEYRFVHLDSFTARIEVATDHGKEYKEIPCQSKWTFEFHPAPPK